MNYEKIYSTLILRAKDRILKKYKERHHIIPEHFFIDRKRKGPPGWLEGNPEDKSNIVYLTPEEHYLAHQLLVKIYPDIKSLVFTLIRMSGKGKIHNNKAFGWIKRKNAEAMKKLKLGRTEEEIKLTNEKMANTRKAWTDEKKILVSKKNSESATMYIENRTLAEAEFTRQKILENIDSSNTKRAKRREERSTQEKLETKIKMVAATTKQRSEETIEEKENRIKKQKATRALRTPEQKNLTNKKRAETFARKKLKVTTDERAEIENI
jgi:hypothetical protein